MDLVALGQFIITASVIVAVVGILGGVALMIIGKWLQRQ